jgi:bud emergence protein 1
VGGTLAPESNNIARRSMSPYHDARAPGTRVPMGQMSAKLTAISFQVIKALYDYKPADPSPNSGYLAFSQGDFLHVVGREDDSDWYEACNPLHGTRGLVPVSYFEGVGKTVRDSGGSAPRSSTPQQPQQQQQQQQQPHDSGYQERITSPQPSAQDIMTQQMRMSRGGGRGAMVYGIVIYDFKAERPDELEAKEGEAIIVIAQSNPEWFVAKPITRLGGPGLIPVSFIEIRDMTTGQAVADTQAAVTAAGVPKVEEWKKMAADYKNGSIPLGKLETNSGQSLQQGMERMSVKSNGGHNKAGSVSRLHPAVLISADSVQVSHSRNGSMAQARNQYRTSDNLLAPIKACVPRYCFADDIFWFIIECQMEDGRHWELQRLYQDFYDLQIQLIATYPVEAGTSGSGERTLPFMPGPVTYVTDNISNGRRANLDEYIKNLLKLGPHITQGHLVKGFFAPRQGDYEIDPDIVAAEEYRLSQQSHQSSNQSQGTSRQSSADQLQATTPVTPYSTGSNYPSHQRGQSTASQAYSSNLNPPPMTHAHSSSSTATSTGTSSALKIKVWFEEDNCVVIRMPISLKFVDLYNKLVERRKMERPGEEEEELIVEYKDEQDNYFYPIENDEDLQIAVERNPKLTLSVTTRR